MNKTEFIARYGYYEDGRTREWVDDLLDADEKHSSIRHDLYNEIGGDLDDRGLFDTQVDLTLQQLLAITSQP